MQKSILSENSIKEIGSEAGVEIVFDFIEEFTKIIISAAEFS